MKTLIIFYNKEKTCYQVVRPNNTFKGDYDNLASYISGGTYTSFEIV